MIIDEISGDKKSEPVTPSKFEKSINPKTFGSKLSASQE